MTHNLETEESKVSLVSKEFVPERVQPFSRRWGKIMADKKIRYICELETVVITTADTAGHGL